MAISNTIFSIILPIFFIVFFIIYYVAKNPQIRLAIMTAGIGSILAGTFFGVVKNIIINKPADGNIIYLLVFCFFVWYVFTKIASISLANQEFQQVNENTPTSNINVKETEVEIKKLKSSFESYKPKLSGLYKAFISIIIIFVAVILVLSVYNSSQTGGSLYIYNIFMACMITVAVLFAFFSGSRLDITTKIEILSFTLSFAIIFGVFAPVFVFNSFSMKNSVTTTLIFFVWMSLTSSITNFLEDKQPAINRH